jgi:peptidoglycan/xylan/chitin deacetylase (PgdA/CDA1 family)
MSKSMDFINVKIKQNIKRCLAKGMRHSGPRYKSVVLNYHSIHPSNPYSTKPEDFEEQMAFLLSNYNIISLDELYNKRIAGWKPDRDYAVVTFDDGYEDNYRYAFRILRKFNIKATIFIMTGFVNGEVDIRKMFKECGQLKPLNWSQIREMQTFGISFGSHTHTHPNLASLTSEQLLKELALSKQLLERNLGEEVTLLAYPFGQKVHFNGRVEQLAKEAGYRLACSTIWGCDNSKASLFALRRIRIDAYDTLDDFRGKISGCWDFIGLLHTWR